MSRFKIGDRVQFTEDYLNGYKRNDWWVDWNLSWRDVCGEFIVVSTGDYDRIQISPVKHLKIILIFYDYKLKPVQTLSKTERIVQKIKYLDKQFMEKKHVKV